MPKITKQTIHEAIENYNTIGNEAYRCKTIKNFLDSTISQLAKEWVPENCSPNVQGVHNRAVHLGWNNAIAEIKQRITESGYGN